MWIPHGEIIQTHHEPSPPHMVVCQHTNDCRETVFGVCFFHGLQYKLIKNSSLHMAFTHLSFPQCWLTNLFSECWGKTGVHFNGKSTMYQKALHILNENSLSKWTNHIGHRDHTNGPIFWCHDKQHGTRRLCLMTAKECPTHKCRSVKACELYLGFFFS